MGVSRGVCAGRRQPRFADNTNVAVMEEVVLLEVHRVQRRRAENKLSPELQVGLVRRERPHVYRVPIPTTQVRNARFIQRILLEPPTRHVYEYPLC